MIVSLHLRTYYCDAASENLATLDTKGGPHHVYYQSVITHVQVAFFVYKFDWDRHNQVPILNKNSFFYLQVPETREISVLVGALLKRLQPSLPSANKSNRNTLNFFNGSKESHGGYI